MMIAQKHIWSKVNLAGRIVETTILTPNNINNKFTFSTSYSSTSPKEEFTKHFLVRIHYNNPQDAYYETYSVRQQFRKQIKQLQDSNQCYIFGGDQFPQQSTQFVVNCDDKLFIEQFLNKVLLLQNKKQNVYSDKKLIKEYQIEEVVKISDEKMKKLSYFYQYL